jgi:hypothetical protein
MMNDSFDYDSEYEIQEFDSEWPQPSRRTRFPNLNFLKRNNFQPMRDPEPLEDWVLQTYEQYKKDVEEGEKVKKEGLVKVIELENKIKDEQEKVDNTYASKWSSKLNAGDALINRLQNDLSKLIDDYRQKVSLVSKLHEKNQTLCTYIKAHNELVKFCEGVKEENKIYSDEMNRMYSDRS